MGTAPRVVEADTKELNELIKPKQRTATRFAIKTKVQKAEEYFC